MPGSALALGRYDARNGDECREQVNANFDAMAEKMRASGNARGVASMERRGRAVYLAECGQMDRSAQSSLLSKGYARLTAAQATLASGRALPPAERASLAEDHRAIVDYPHSAYRDAYLRLHAEVSALQAQLPPGAPVAEPAPAPAAAVPAPATAPAPALESGRLRPYGAWLSPPSGHTVTVLSDGAVLVVGEGPAPSLAEDPAARSAEWRARRGAAAVVHGPDPGPKLWDPVRRGWRRLPPPPDCVDGHRNGHTATALPSGLVLMAGGLCDRGKMRDDPSLQAPHFALSLWDSATRGWLAAPTLRQARLGHSASLMPDGSVLLVGGHADPALAPGPEEPVLASTERYVAGAVQPAPTLQKARAGHTSTVLPDGSVLVVGGFDAQGRAIGQAEWLAPGAAGWREVAGPRVPRHGHSATLLSDGRVLVAGGVGPDGSARREVEVWDPGSGRWSDAALLPVALHGHAATLLANGQVLVAGGANLGATGAVPWAWTWLAAVDSWQLAGRTETATGSEMARQVTLVPRPDGSALVFTSPAILRWEPVVSEPGTAGPVWRAPPVAAALPDGRVMLVGRSGRDGDDSLYAHLWHPARGTWAEAGRLGPGVRQNGSLLALPTGRVLHVAIDDERRLVCERWDPDSAAWQGCGVRPLEYLSDSRVELGLLPDGRAMAVPNKHELLVLDESRAAWLPWRAEWNGQDVAFGAPVRLSKPLGRAFDPESGKGFEINDLAARTWGLRDGYGRSALWDPRAGIWVYLLNDRSMGRNAHFLPDGCVISTGPLAVFDPLTGKATPLVDPGLGINPRQAEMVVLGDGTVVIAGVPLGSRDPGAGLFQRRAGCDGFEARPEDAGYIAGGLAVDPPAVAASAVPEARPAWSARAWEVAREKRWLLLAVAGPLAAFFLLQRLGLRRVQVGRPWVLRTLVWGAVIVFVGPALWNYLHFDRTVKAAEPEPGAVAGTVPCRLVGVWSSQQGNQQRRIELKDDGTYAMAPSAGGIDPPAGYHGQWAVQGDKIVWRSAGSLDADINPMLPESPTRFTLVEGNGSRTQYELIRAVSSRRCKG
jgi:hypothetical protein